MRIKWDKCTGREIDIEPFENNGIKFIFFVVFDKNFPVLINCMFVCENVSSIYMRASYEELRKSGKKW